MRFCSMQVGSRSNYKVESAEGGQLLLDIKQMTNSNKIQTSLALLTDEYTPSSDKMYYHQNCLYDAERTCKDSNNHSGKKDAMILKLADIELISFVL